jgi:single-strand DNA-binding protein
MANFNRVILMGNLTRDPDYKQFGGGSLCKLNIASNRQYKNRQTGDMNQEVCYIDVEVWGNQAENCNKYLQKGRSVLVEGRLKLDSWEQDGQPRRKHLIVADKVVFLGSQQSEQYKDDNQSYQPQQSASYQKQNQPQQSQQQSQDFKDEPPFDDDLPF